MPIKVDCFTFAKVFEDRGNGEAVLNHLTLLYWKNPYNPESATDTAYRAGQMAVIDYINHQLNEAHSNDGLSRTSDN